MTEFVIGILIFVSWFAVGIIATKLNIQLDRKVSENPETRYRTWNTERVIPLAVACGYISIFIFLFRSMGTQWTQLVNSSLFKVIYDWIVK